MAFPAHILNDIVDSMRSIVVSSSQTMDKVRKLERTASEKLGFIPKSESTDTEASHGEQVSGLSDDEKHKLQVSLGHGKSRLT